MTPAHRYREADLLHPRERIERAFHVSFILPDRAAQLLDAYRDQVRQELLEEVLAEVRTTLDPPDARHNWHWFSFARNRIARRLVERFDLQENSKLQ